MWVFCLLNLLSLIHTAIPVLLAIPKITGIRSRTGRNIQCRYWYPTSANPNFSNSWIEEGPKDSLTTESIYFDANSTKFSLAAYFFYLDQPMSGLFLHKNHPINPLIPIATYPLLWGKRKFGKPSIRQRPSDPLMVTSGASFPCQYYLLGISIRSIRKFGQGIGQLLFFQQLF